MARCLGVGVSTGKPDSVLLQLLHALGRVLSCIQRKMYERSGHDALSLSNSRHRCETYQGCMHTSAGDLSVGVTLVDDRHAVLHA